MPPIRAVTLQGTAISFLDVRGVLRTFDASQIPAGATIAQAEAAANTWLANNISAAQVRIHIFSLSPLRWVPGVWNLGLPIAANWWEE